MAAADVSAVALLREVDGSLVLHVDAGSLRIARGDGGSWTVEDALPVHPVRGPLGLARDAGGVLQVSFLAGEAALPELWHARDSGAGFVAQQVAEEVRAVSSLALAADGTLALGAMGAYGFPVELWSSPPEGSWSFETADLLSWVGGDVSLAFDALGWPHLAYQDPSRNLRHAWREAGAWRVEHVDASGDVGAASHIAIAADGRAHVLHHDTARDLVRWSHAP